MRLSIPATALIRQGSFYLLFCLFLSACLPTPQVKQLNIRLEGIRRDIPMRVELTQVPFYPQTKYHCGPAAVATIIGHQGSNVNYNQIVNRVYSPGRKGSLQSDVISALRRYNYLSYVMNPQFEDVLREIAAGRPVLVLQNLGVKWISKWHYAVIIGYDLKQQNVILRSGKIKRRITGFKLFERTWKRSGYWALLALKPGELPRVADPINYLRAVIGLEKQKQWNAAFISYIKAEQKWPDNLIAKMGVANSLYNLGDINAAIYKYRAIIQADPKAADAYNNLATLLAQQMQYASALYYIGKAIKLGGQNRAVYQETHREITRKKKLAN